MIMNKTIFFLASATMVLNLAACAQGPAESTSTSSIVETSAPETSSSEVMIDEIVTTAPGETYSNENTIAGTVTGGTEHSINITTEDGTELEFYIGDDTAEDYDDGYLIDRKVLITYTGLIDATNTDSVNVLKISDFK